MVIDRDGVLAHKGIVGASNDVNNTIAVIEQSLMVSGIFRAPAAEAGVRVYPDSCQDEVHFESEEPLRHVRASMMLQVSLVLSEIDFSGPGRT